MRVFGLSKRTSTPTFTSIIPLSRVYLKSRKYRLFLQTQPDFALKPLHLLVATNFFPKNSRSVSTSVLRVYSGFYYTVRHKDAVQDARRRNSTARDHTSVAALNHSPVLNALAAAVRSMAPGMGISGICLAACHTAAA